MMEKGLIKGSDYVNVDECPFGEGVQKYWDKRHQLFSLFNEGVIIDRESLYSISPEKIAAQNAIETGSTLRVLDAFCGVGGDSIALAKAGHLVIACDTNEDRLKATQQNAEIYKVAPRITFEESCALDAIDDHEFDVAYFDPPWGGPDYYKKEQFRLRDFAVDGNILIENALEQEKCHTVVFKIPTNFNIAELEQYNSTVRHRILDDRHIFSHVFISTL